MPRNIFLRMFLCLFIYLSVIREVICSNGKNCGENQFYTNSKIYWSNIPATNDGMTGISGVSDNDIVTSRAFLNKILSNHTSPGSKLALDCGAGIGRVTKNVLMPLFDKVDLVEQDDKFVNAAILSIGTNHPKLGTVYKTCVQDFHPDKKYDVVWMQWILCYLTDEDVCSVLVRIRDALNENGVICIKDNVARKDNLQFKIEDSLVIRPHELLMKLFEKARLRVIQIKVQEGLPDYLHPVHMFAVVPIALNS